MTWTYNAATRTDRNRTREAIGDTDSRDEQLADEILDELLVTWGAVAGAAVAAVQLLMAKYSRLVSSTTGPISTQHSNRLAAYQTIMGELRGGQYAAPYAGGISVSDNERLDSNTDRVRPTFASGMNDHPDSKAGTGDGSRI